MKYPQASISKLKMTIMLFCLVVKITVTGISGMTNIKALDKVR
jgi:hypothetical protein